MGSELSTGISGLDRLIGGLRPGDSVFWHVNDARCYWDPAERFADACRGHGRSVVCISWSPEDCRCAERVRADSSFCFDPTKPMQEQLDTFLDFASGHGKDCFVIGIPPAKRPQGYEEFRLMRFLGKVFAQLFWLDKVSYFGFLESQFDSESLTILHDIPRILVRCFSKGDTRTLRLLKAPGRPLVDTQVVYSLSGDKLEPIQPGEPSLSDFQSIVEREENVVWLLGLNRELAYISRGTLGLSREELIAHGPALLGESDPSGPGAPILSGIAEALRTGNPALGIETRNVNRKTGNEEHFVHNVIPLRDKENRPYGFLGTSTNVTEMKRREEILRKSEAGLRELAEQLAESERKYRTLFNSAPDIISVIDKESRLLEVNPAVCKLTGYSRDELLKMTCADLAKDLDLKLFRSLFEESSVPWSIRNEYCFVNKDGTRTPLEFCAVRLDEDRALFISRDITEQKAAEEDLKASEEMFRSLVRQAGLGIVYFSAKGEYLDVNDALCKMTGYSREELLEAKDARPYSPDEYVSEHIAHVRRGLSGKTEVIETMFRRKNGELFLVRIHPSPIMDHTGKQVGLIGIIEDVTAWKELQRQVIHSQRMEVASFLSVAIAHEFNNLHGGIQGHAELALSSKDLPNDVRECLEVILKTLQKAESITAQLDKFSREIPPHKTPCSLSEVIDDTVELVSREFEGEGIEIDVRNDPGIPDLVIDDAQIGQVLLNLFINARDAMAGKRTKVLSVETGRRGKRAFIKVSDTGSGIALENTKRIFEAFFTTKGDTDGKDAHGLGLGLTVSKTIVGEHRGDIRVSSKKGKGTTFTIWLPLDKGPSRARATRARRAKGNGTAQSSRRR